MTVRLFADLTAPRVPQLDPAGVAVLAVGAVEQHGPHLPMSTDFIVADTFVRDLAVACGDAHDLWLLPPLAVTKSNEHAWAPGTLWLSASTLMAVIDDIARCLAKSPLRKLVFLNGHGGNSALLQVSARDVRLAYGLQTFVMHPSLPPDHGGASPATERGTGIHGGIDETSIMLHLRPDLVDLTKARYNVPEHLSQYRHVRFGGPVSFGWLSNDFGTDGTLGDPTQASAEHGKRLYDAMLVTAEDALAEIARFSPRP
jgi:creatinine amidohydrolase